MRSDVDQNDWLERVGIVAMGDRDLVEKFRWYRRRSKQIVCPDEQDTVIKRARLCADLLMRRGFDSDKISKEPLCQFRTTVSPCVSIRKPVDPSKPMLSNVHGVRFEPVSHWHQHIMEIANLVARKSKDSTKVGAVLVGDNNVVLLTAFNGTPIGVQDSPERLVRPEKYKWASHAETNLIAFAAREGIRTAGRTVYTTHMPCSACARTLIQAGVKSIFVGEGTFGEGSAMNTEHEVTKIMFAEAAVKCLFLN